ncbi:heme exporter protein CcmD [Stenotrophomonas maltophilia]|jgi:heme exporter protein D|uniref:Heme exporter protein D n=1 Tax=Stenotrophomonas maltophilia TaxID=40324 RepID=A0AAP7L175_STEMA|nr:MULTISPECIES: heme exporter protein CcmD [Stenotrophomonas]KOQ70461.1 cytochrome C biogenesis protein CcmD [Stenotrophomonas maltophilia]MBA0221045.1 heme exporter protein CcmD [Stenotrophomonas maltophilia]MBE5270140.1 heme exporter protein CcmD [Stenotrophomonas sp. B2]MBH1591692.1 heme exporter protein CcmD [Stenotrophomonas maltophilia]MBH1664073.1 heme exporter protein CcmD [Stenotrophomonas maltophilia]
MSHLPYVIGAYAVFVLVLCADALGSWLRLRAARRMAQARQQRQQARASAQDVPPSLSTELER